VEYLPEGTLPVFIEHQRTILACDRGQRALCDDPFDLRQ
jgi:hypothetical protein